MIEIENSSFKLQGSYQTPINSHGVVLNLNFSSTKPLLSQNKYVLIVLDTSNEMQGDNLYFSKVAISDFITNLYKLDNIPKIDLITFDSEARFHSLQNKDLPECLQIISQITSDETAANLAPVLELIQAILSGEKVKNSLITQKSKKLKKEISENTEQPFNPSKDFQADIVFISGSDLEDSSSLGNLIELKHLGEEKLDSLAFHTVTMRGDKNAYVLESMTKMMPAEGIFQDVYREEDMRPVLEDLYYYIKREKLHATIGLERDMTTTWRPVTFLQKKKRNNGIEEEGKECLWEGKVCLLMDKQDFEERRHHLRLKMKVEQNVIAETVPLEHKESAKKDVFAHCLLINCMLKEKLERLLDARQANETVELLEVDLAIFRDVFKDLLFECLESQNEEGALGFELVDTLEKLVSDIKNMIDLWRKESRTVNQMISETTLVYRQRLILTQERTKDQNELQKIELWNETNLKAKEKAAKINDQDFRQKYEKLNKKLQRNLLQRQDLENLLKAGECLCLTFEAEKVQSHLQCDATEVRIRSVDNLLWRANLYSQSQRFGVKITSERDQIQVSLAERNKSTLFAMPLYLCAEHWELASEYLKPVLLAHQADWSQDSYRKQLRTLPFLLLAYLKNSEEEYDANPGTEELSRLVFETCCQILKDEIARKGENNFVEEVIHQWKNYEKDGTIRGLETIPDNQAFMAQIYCLKEIGALVIEEEKVLIEKMKYFLEEDMRRRVKKYSNWTYAVAERKIKLLLNLKVDYYLIRLREEEDAKKNAGKIEEEKKTEEENDDMEIEDSSTVLREEELKEIYQRSQTEIVEEKATKKKNKKPKSHTQKKNWEEKKNSKDRSVFKFTISQEFLEKMAEFGLDPEALVPGDFPSLEKSNSWGEISKAEYNSVVKRLKLWLKLMGSKIDNLKQKKTFGLNTPLQYLALYIQNKMHMENAERQRCFKTNNYFDPFDPEAARNFLFCVISEVIYSSWEKRLDRKPKPSACLERDIEIFAETQVLEVAAGVLLSGFNLGSFEYLQHLLKKDPLKNNKVMEKLMMIKNQEYNGVKFSFDFEMRRKFLKQLFVRYQDEYSYEVWEQLPGKKEKETKSQRRAGGHNRGRGGRRRDDAY